MKKYKGTLKIIWISLIVIAIGCYLFYPEFFEANTLNKIVHQNHTLIISLYVLLTCIRALFFIPSTVFLIMGIALFPSEPVFVIAVNLIGILIGGLLLYKAADFFTEDRLFSAKKQGSLATIKEKMNRYGFSIVLAWSFFPVAPTDLICYVAGAVRMRIAPFIAALFLGELLLVTIYVYSGKSLMAFLF